MELIKGTITKKLLHDFDYKFIINLLCMLGYARTLRSWISNEQIRETKDFLFDV